MKPLCESTIAEIRSLLAKREVSYTDIVASITKRIAEREKEINSYITLFLEEAKEKAEKLDTNHLNHGPLTGIPIAIKDNICVKDKLTTCGSKILYNFVSPYNATATERLNGADAIFLGKTNLDEFAMGSSSETSYFGPVHNPRDLTRVPGGSSGGSAAAVAYGGAIAALGSDTGGSVRQPASFCGVVGLKPTYGRVSRNGLVAFASSLDGIGVISRSVEDAGLILETIAGVDPCDSTSVDKPVDFVTGIAEDVGGIKIGIPSEYFPKELDPEIKGIILNMVEKIAGRCQAVIDLSLPNTEYAVAAYYILAMAEASSNLARYDGVRYGHRALSQRLSELYEKTRDEGFGEEIKRRILLGTYGLSKGYYDEYYLVAQKVRTLIRNDFEQAFTKVDAIITPTTPTTAFKLGEKTQDPLAMYLGDIFTVSPSLAGLPAISIPAEELKDGLPVGLQIIGRPFDEKTILKLAHAFEKL
jgi:aspartyl-tRNA(Asn)/glutamyl-tRNA(Gln) amidotransferase subunit A